MLSRRCFQFPWTVVQLSYCMGSRTCAALGGKQTAPVAGLVLARAVLESLKGQGQGAARAPYLCVTAMPAFLDRIVRSLEDGWDQGNDITRDNPTTVALIGAGAVLVGGYWLSQSRNSRKPGTTQLSGGGIARSEVKKEFTDYSKAYSEQPGAGIKERSRTTELVDTFCEDPSFDAAK